MPCLSLRSAAVPLLLFISAAVPNIYADDVQDAWKGLIMQALYAAGANDYAKAEQLFQKALHEADRFGVQDPRVGTTLNSLGLVYRAAKKPAEAASAFERAGVILEKAYGPQSTDVANVNFNIASSLMDLGKQPAALPYLKKCLTTYQIQFGGESVKTGAVLCMVGEAYSAARDFQQAEAPLKRCAQIREADGGLISAPVGEALNSLAMVYRQEGKYTDADREFKLVERIRERTLGIMSPGLAETLEAHAALLKTMGRDPEAEKDSLLAATIRRNERRTR